MKRLLSLLLIAAVCLSLVACGSNSPGTSSGNTSDKNDEFSQGAGGLEAGPAEGTPEAAEYAKEVTVSLSLSTLDPGAGWAAHKEGYCRLVFDNLFYMDDSTGDVTMQLAKSVEWTDDTVTALRVVLRDDIVFSNGSPVTTADVEFSLGRTTYGNLKNYYDRCEIISPTEMIIHLTQPYLNYYAMLSRSAAAIVCKEEAEKHPEGLALIGSGPYVYDMDTHVAKSSITLNRNELFWGEKNPTEKIHVVWIADASSAAIALQSGDVNFIPSVKSEEIPNLQKDEKVKVASFPGYSFVYMGFNDRGAAVPEEEKNFRRAVACAIDKDAFVAAIGGGKVMTALWPWDNPAYIDDETAFEHDLSYNPEKAKEYLSQAGGKTSFTCLAQTGTASVKIGVQLVQEYLRQVGITMEIIETDASGFSAMTKWGVLEYDALMHTNLFSIKAGGYSFFTPKNNVNRAMMVNDTVVAAYTTAMGASDEAKQIEQHQIILNEVHDSVSYLPLAWSMVNIGYSAGLENFSVSSGGCYALRDVCLRTN